MKTCAAQARRKENQRQFHHAPPWRNVGRCEELRPAKPKRAFAVVLGEKSIAYQIDTDNSNNHQNNIAAGGSSGTLDRAANCARRRVRDISSLSGGRRPARKYEYASVARSRQQTRTAT
jgi:hypothetical protein